MTRRRGILVSAPSAFFSAIDMMNLKKNEPIDFDIEVLSTLQKINQLLVEKGKEYRRNGDPYHNFNEGSKITGFIPERVLDGFLMKHVVSYRDMINDIEQGKLPKVETVEEKFNDILVYFTIQKAMILERIKNQK
jgi:hypothetical protein